VSAGGADCRIKRDVALLEMFQESAAAAVIDDLRGRTRGVGDSLARASALCNAKARDRLPAMGAGRRRARGNTQIAMD
jgi:hypothetical protein